MKIIAFLLGIIGMIYLLGPMSIKFPIFANFIILTVGLTVTILSIRWFVAFLRQCLKERDEYYEHH